MFSIVCSTNALPGLNRKTSIRSQDYSSTKSLRIFLAILLTVGLLACSVVEALAQSGEAESGMIAPRGLHPRLQKQGKRVPPYSRLPPAFKRPNLRRLITSVSSKASTVLALPIASIRCRPIRFSRPGRSISSKSLIPPSHFLTVLPANECFFRTCSPFLLRRAPCTSALTRW